MQPYQKPLSSLLIGLVSLLGAALVFASAVALGLSAFLPLMEGKRIQSTGTILGWSFGFEALLLFAAAFFCLQKYLERPQADTPVQFHLKMWHILALLIGTAISLGIGYFAAENRTISWIVLPLFTVPAVMLPILLFFGFGARQIQLGPRWRVWGILGLGMTLGPLILIIIELLILLFIIIGAAIILGSQPGISTDMMRFFNEVNGLQNDQEAILNLIIPYILKPGVIITTILYMGLMVPLTEELVKPIGVWLFAGKLESPAQGFALGTLSGAAYALVETFGSSGQPSASWAGLLAARIGTSLLHVTTTGLMGWGIALAWQKRQYLRLIFIYLLSVLLHGSWNTSVLFYSFSTLAHQAASTNMITKIGPYAIGATIFVGAILLTILLLTNARLIKTDPIPAPPTDGNITP
jgi:protease prsW family protein